MTVPGITATVLSSCICTIITSTLTWVLVANILGMHVHSQMHVKNIHALPVMNAVETQAFKEIKNNY